MAANLTPHWGIVIFLVAIYVISFLLHLDPNITNTGGATATIPALSIINFTLFLLVLGTALIAAAAAGILGNWAGGSAFFIIFGAGIAVTGTWTVLVFLLDVATFSNLGIPDWIQFAIAAPCILMLTWTILAFLSGVLGIGKEIST